MKVIDDSVNRLRAVGWLHAASMLKSWKSALAFVALCFVAGFEWQALIRFVFWGKLVIAGIGLATWLTDAYFIRKHWGLESKRDGSI
jgi:hypothetical protein